jgi:hypothetical protein
VTSLAGVALAVCLAVMVYLQTRPAYLRLTVDPPDAQVLLDGEPYNLTDGAIVIESGPGGHEVEVSAPGHRAQYEQVTLVRGRAEMAALDVNLIPLLGRLHLESDPPSAEVEVFNAENQRIARGATPFISNALPSGQYKVRVSRELYKPVELAASAPEGNQTASLGVVTLEPASSESKNYVQLLKLREIMARRLDQPLDLRDLPLRDAVQKLTDATGLAVQLDEPALASVGIDPDWKIRTSLTAGPLKDSLKRLVWSLDLSLNPVLVDDSFHFQITTPNKSDTSLVTVLHPVEDLISPELPDWNNLTRNVQSSVRMATWARAGGPAGINSVPELRALSVQQSWMTQLEVLEFLTELERRRVAGDKGGVLLKSDDERAVAVAAEKWLKLIDEGRFAASWEQGSEFLRQHNSRDKWVKARKSTPRPAARAKGRKLRELTFLPKAPPGMGEVPAVMLSYRTPGSDFDFYETVVFAKFDGRWQATGYIFTQARAAPVPIAPR